MANDFNANPLKIDTNMAGGAGVGRLLRVTQIVWIVGATGGNLIITEPTSGKTLAEFADAAANTEVSQSFAVPRKWRDFEIASVPSGTVYVFLA